MKKFFPFVFLTLMGVMGFSTAHSQFSANEIRRNFKHGEPRERGLERYKRYTSVGFTLNAFNYFGDLAPFDRNFSSDITLTRPGLGIVASRRIAPRLSIRGTYTFGRLRGDDFSANPNLQSTRDRYRRNLHFKNDIHEFGFNGVVDLLRNRGDYTKRAYVTPYAFLGLAIFHHNPKAQVPVNLQSAGSDWVELRPLQTEGKSYSNVQFAVPFGLGARIRVSSHLDISAEIGFRMLNFDYLDDVSNVYVDPGTLNSDLSRIMAARSQESVAAATGRARNSEIVMDAQNRIYIYDSGGTQYKMFEGNKPGNRRGDPNNNDLYMVTSFQLTYIIPPRIFDPKFRN